MKRSKRLTIPRAAARMLPALTHLRRLFVALVALLSDGTWDGQQPAVGAARTRSAASSLPDVIDIVWLPAQGGTTGISTVGAASETDGWYSLDGRKLDGKPTKEGLYINNGKKVVIK